MESPRPRVFVSSVIEGFGDYREAAREGIEAAGGEPVLVNEDFPSLPDSSRNACLDAVASSDVYLAIIGVRAGWEAPSGKLVVEEEFEEARRQDLPVLLFLAGGEREEEASRLASRLSDYVEGYFRVEVSSPEELRREVQEALGPVIDSLGQHPIDLGMVQELVSNPHDLNGQPSLRLVLAPARSEEVIDPVTLNEKDFEHKMYELAHGREVGLFDYEKTKESRTTADSLIISQRSSGRGRRGREDTRLEVRKDGILITDLSVAPSGSSTGGIGAGLVIVRDDLRQAARRAFAFGEAFYDDRDDYLRYQQFVYNASLANHQNRSIVEDLDSNQQSFSVPHRTQRGPIVAHDSPRSISRNTLRQPEDEIERTVTVIERRREEENPQSW